MSDVLKHVDNRLGSILKERGIKQSWLCEKTGISSANMSRMCKGDMYPTLLSAHRISRLLGLTIEDIWPWKEDAD